MTGVLAGMWCPAISVSVDWYRDVKGVRILFLNASSSTCEWEKCQHILQSHSDIFESYSDPRHSESLEKFGMENYNPRVYYSHIFIYYSHILIYYSHILSHLLIHLLIYVMSQLLSDLPV